MNTFKPITSEALLEMIQIDQGCDAETLIARFGKITPVPGICTVCHTIRNDVRQPTLDEVVWCRECDTRTVVNVRILLGLVPKFGWSTE